MSDLEMALQIACEVHRNQKQQDCNDNHIMHVLEVIRMFPVNSNKLRIVAALHDANDQNRFTSDELKECGFTQDVIELLEFMKRQVGETLNNYIYRMAENEDAKAIKIAEYTHLLLNATRNIQDKDKRLKLETRYRDALEYWQRKQ